MEIQKVVLGTEETFKKERKGNGKVSYMEFVTNLEAGKYNINSKPVKIDMSKIETFEIKKPISENDKEQLKLYGVRNNPTPKQFRNEKGTRQYFKMDICAMIRKWNTWRAHERIKKLINSI